jgi:hypothetical protein
VGPQGPFVKRLVVVLVALAGTAAGAQGVDVADTVEAIDNALTAVGSVATAGLLIHVAIKGFQMVRRALS